MADFGVLYVHFKDLCEQQLFKLQKLLPLRRELHEVHIREHESRNLLSDLLNDKIIQNYF